MLGFKISGLIEVCFFILVVILSTRFVKVSAFFRPYRFRLISYCFSGLLLRRLMTEKSLRVHVLEVKGALVF